MKQLIARWKRDAALILTGIVSASVALGVAIGRAISGGSGK